MAEYIDRDALLKEIYQQKAMSAHSFPRSHFVIGDVLACIQAAPAADVAPVVHGRWGWYEKQLVYLEIAFDLISKIHSDICNNGNRKNDTADYTLNVLTQMSLLKTKLKGGFEQ